MKEWLLSVAGIAILSVLADIILPVGQTKKYIKTVIGVAITLATVEPLLSVFSSETYPTVATSVEISTQQSYLDYVAQTQTDEVSKVKSALCSAGFDNVEVTFDAKSHKLVATMRVGFSEESNVAAQSAVNSANCRYSVVFRWNDE